MLALTTKRAAKSSLLIQDGPSVPIVQQMEQIQGQLEQTQPATQGQALSEESRTDAHYVGVVIYVVSTEEAMTRCWKSFVRRPAGRNADYVEHESFLITEQ